MCNTCRRLYDHRTSIGHADECEMDERRVLIRSFGFTTVYEQYGAYCVFYAGRGVTAMGSKTDAIAYAEGYAQAIEDASTIRKGH